MRWYFQMLELDEKLESEEEMMPQSQLECEKFWLVPRGCSAQIRNRWNTKIKAHLTNSGLPGNGCYNCV